MKSLLEDVKLLSIQKKKKRIVLYCLCLEKKQIGRVWHIHMFRNANVFTVFGNVCKTLDKKTCFSILTKTFEQISSNLCWRV
jgi:hypothetical protein